MQFKSFEDIYAKHLEEKKIKYKINKDNVIYSRENVNFLKQMVRNRSYTSQIARFERIDNEFDLLSLEEEMLYKQFDNIEKYNKTIDYINERHVDRNSYEKIIQSLEAIPYLDYKTDWDIEYRDDRSNLGKAFKSLASGIYNLFVKIINLVIRIINTGISLIMQIIQFVSTQILKVLARKTIPKAEFEEKMDVLRRNSFKKDLRTRYPMNVSEVLKVGMRQFAVFGNFTEEKSKIIVDHFNGVLNRRSAPRKESFDLFGKKVEIDIDIDVNNLVTTQKEMERAVAEEASRLYYAIVGSLEKDFLEPLLNSYKDSYDSKLLKRTILYHFTGKENEKTIKDTLNLYRFNYMDNNSLRTLGNGIAKAMFGVKEKAESIDVYEFFRNNAEFITDTADNGLKKFIDMCKNSTKRYKELNKTFGDMIKQKSEHMIEMHKLQRQLVVYMLKCLICPFTRIMCGMINWVRRGFVLEFYKLKLLMLNLWKKAEFGEYSDDELVEVPEQLRIEA